jgi:phosphoribosyl 1,2-cyclic phosphodiesterase
VLRYANLASGSGGNATLIEASSGATTTRLLVDCGLRLRELERRLTALGTSLDALDAVFITHEHSDHVGHARTILQNSSAQLCISHGTWLACDAASWGLATDRVHWMHDAHPFALGDLELHPFTVPHDAREPLQLRCTDGEAQLGVVTDLGHASEHVVSQLQGCHALMLETNHDPDLLARSAYPPFLKSRILGRLGHLSNAHAAQLLEQVWHPGLRHVLAAHLSERNNTPEMALSALQQVMGNRPVALEVASPDANSDWYAVQAH